LGQRRTTYPATAGFKSTAQRQLSNFLLQEEIVKVKRTKIALAQQQLEKDAKHREWKTEKERQLSALLKNARRRESELQRLRVECDQKDATVRRQAKANAALRAKIKTDPLAKPPAAPSSRKRHLDSISLATSTSVSATITAKAVYGNSQAGLQRNVSQVNANAASTPLKKLRTETKPGVLKTKKDSASLRASQENLPPLPSKVLLPALTSIVGTRNLEEELRDKDNQLAFQNHVLNKRVQEVNQIKKDFEKQAENLRHYQEKTKTLSRRVSEALNESNEYSQMLRKTKHQLVTHRLNSVFEELLFFFRW
jgi:hypothetical protein